LLGATLAGCTNLDLQDPNGPSTGTFWQTAGDALAGVNAAYNALQNNGTYGRWLVFATDLRSDIGMILSPWTDLSNFTKFTFTSYDFEVNREIWQHHYQAIFRANQVIARVPAIPMDATLRDRIVGEAKFIRALMYLNLVTLYGNVPLITTPPQPTDRPATVGPPELWAQIEQDLTQARPVLPRSYSGNDLGRATWGAATALLGKAYMQQGKWSQADAALAEVIGSGLYDLMPNYADNFAVRYAADTTQLFFKKYGEYYLGLPGQDWDAAINFRVIRYADVLLLDAEALNELGRTAEAYPLVDRVRARVTLPPLPAGLSADSLRERILRERMFELGLEGQRWADLERHARITPALQAEDPE